MFSHKARYFLKARVSPKSITIAEDVSNCGKLNFMKNERNLSFPSGVSTTMKCHACKLHAEGAVIALATISFNSSRGIFTEVSNLRTE